MGFGVCFLERLSDSWRLVSMSDISGLVLFRGYEREFECNLEWFLEGLSES